MGKVKLNGQDSFFDIETMFYIVLDEVLELPSFLSPKILKAIEDKILISEGEEVNTPAPSVNIIQESWIGLPQDLFINNMETVEDIEVLKAYKNWEVENKRRSKVLKYFSKRGV